MTPKITKTKMNVPTNSAQKPCTFPTPNDRLNDATPRPTSWAFEPSAPTIASAPIVAPTTCAGTYSGTSFQGNFPETANPSVTAGLMWLPDTWPSAYTVAMTTVPKAKEMTPRSAIVNGASPLTIKVAGTAPTPMKTSNAVPSTSAANFCDLVFSSMTTPKVLLDSSAESRRVFDNVE